MYVKHILYIQIGGLQIKEKTWWHCNVVGDGLDLLVSLEETVTANLIGVVSFGMTPLYSQKSHSLDR